MVFWGEHLYNHICYGRERVYVWTLPPPSVRPRWRLYCCRHHPLHTDPDVRDVSDVPDPCPLGVAVGVRDNSTVPTSGTSTRVDVGGLVLTSGSVGTWEPRGPRGDGDFRVVTDEDKWPERDEGHGRGHASFQHRFRPVTALDQSIRVRTPPRLCGLGVTEWGQTWNPRLLTSSLPPPRLLSNRVRTPAWEVVYVGPVTSGRVPTHTWSIVCERGKTRIFLGSQSVWVCEQPCRMDAFLWWVKPRALLTRQWVISRRGGRSGRWTDVLE